MLVVLPEQRLVSTTTPVGIGLMVNCAGSRHVESQPAKKVHVPGVNVLGIPEPVTPTGLKRLPVKIELPPVAVVYHDTGPMLVAT